MTAAELSSREEGVWLLQQLAPDHGLANLGMMIEVPVRLDQVTLARAFTWVVRQHESLRSCFAQDGGRLARRVLPPGSVDPAVDILTEVEGELAAEVTGYACAPFDLAHGLPIRVGLFERFDGRQVVAVVVHHIVVDHGGLTVLINELVTAYGAFATQGRPPEPRTFRGQRTPTPPTEEALSYWREHVAGADPEATALHGARSPSEPPTFAGSHLLRRFSSTSTQAVTALARRFRLTENMVLLSAYYLLLLLHGAGPDMVVGVRFNTGFDEEEDGPATPDFRIDTVPLRIQADPAEGFTVLADQVRDGFLSIFDYPGVTYEMVPGGAVGAGGWRRRLFRHVFNFQVGFSPVPESSRPDASAGPGLGQIAIDVKRGGSIWGEVSPINTGLARFDLDLTVDRGRSGLLLYLVFSTEIHEVAEAEALLERFELIIQQAAADPERSLQSYDLRTEADRELIDRSNATGRKWDGPGSVPAMIYEKTGQTPDAVAVVENDQVITYGDLAASARSVAQELRDHGVTSGEIIAVAGLRGADSAAALLGIWMAGGTYLPLDPAHPAARIAHELDDSGCRLVLNGGLLPDGCLDGREILPVCRAERGSGDRPDLVLPEASDPAYVIYTSGSTGRPKGVTVTHGNLHNLVRHFCDHLAAGPEDATTWLTTLTFDISALELWLPLASGGRVVVVSDEVRADPAGFAELTRRAGVTIIQATPTLWRHLAPHLAGELGRVAVLCGGEPLPPALAKRLLDTGCLRLLNVYGPTETTIWSTAADIGPGTTRVTIGHPISNTRIHILDDRLRELPVGMPGSVCIAGDGVAAGYVNLESLTAAAFPVHPLLGRLYRTGDVGLRNHDGSLTLMGRSDRQIKVRGHRIELNEIESVLAEHPEVNAAAVVRHPDTEGEDSLVAFVVAAASGRLADLLWRHAADRLPRAAVPTAFVAVDELPTTTNRKVDYLALRSREVRRAALPPMAGGDDPLTDLLVKLWQEHLGNSSLGVTDNFFLNGGQSLLALRLAEHVTLLTGTEVPLDAIFRAPTPAELTREIRALERVAP